VRRQLLDPCAPLERRAEQLAVRYDGVREAQIGGLGAGEVASAGEQLERALVAEAAA
jgi:hypothetical protein